MESLRIKDLKHLYYRLHTSSSELAHLSASVGQYYYRHEGIDAKGKRRPFATPTGRLRRIVDGVKSLLERIELPNCVHGSRKGRSYESNAKPHEYQSELLKVDIADFFPSIKPHRVYKMFVSELDCIPDVARVLTRLVTLDGCLPQGSPTSPIVAALVTRRMARRIEQLAKAHGAVFTQYVDDISISGPNVSHLKERLYSIIEQEGFGVRQEKTELSANDEEKVVTGVRVDRGRDVPKQKFSELKQSICEFEQCIDAGKYLDESRIRSIEGQLNYVRRLNPGASKHFRHRLNRIRRINPKEGVRRAG